MRECREECAGALKESCHIQTVLSFSLFHTHTHTHLAREDGVVLLVVEVPDVECAAALGREEDARSGGAPAAGGQERGVVLGGHDWRLDIFEPDLVCVWTEREKERERVY